MKIGDLGEERPVDPNYDSQFPLRAFPCSEPLSPFSTHINHISLFPNTELHIFQLQWPLIEYLKSKLCR